MRTTDFDEEVVAFIVPPREQMQWRFAGLHLNKEWAVGGGGGGGGGWNRGRRNKQQQIERKAGRKEMFFSKVESGMISSLLHLQR